MRWKQFYFFIWFIALQFTQLTVSLIVTRSNFHDPERTRNKENFTFASIQNEELTIQRISKLNEADRDREEKNGEWKWNNKNINHKFIARQITIGWQTSSTGVAVCDLIVICCIYDHTGTTIIIYIWIGILMTIALLNQINKKLKTLKQFNSSLTHSRKLRF